MSEITFCFWCYAEVQTENLDQHERWHDRLNIQMKGERVSDLQEIIASNAAKAYNEGFERGKTFERERIIIRLQECIRTCQEFIHPGECDYCTAQHDAIEMIQEEDEE